MSACLPRRFPTPAPDPHMIRICKREHRPSIWGWRGCGLCQPPSRDPSWSHSVNSAFWKIHSSPPPPPPGLSSGLATQASRLRSSRPRPGWSRCSGWSGRPLFPSGTLPSPPFFLPPRRPRSWHPLALPPSAPTPTPLLQGSVQARLGLLWHCGFLYYSQQTSQAPRTFELRSLLAEAWAVSSPGSPGPTPHIKLSQDCVPWRALMQRCTLNTSPELRLIPLSLPSHEGRPPTLASASRAQPDVAGTTLGLGCLQMRCRPLTPSEVGSDIPVCELSWG